jgi:regulatory protein
MPGVDEPTVDEAREAAVRLLARREHSVRELERKLCGRGWPQRVVDTVLAELAEQGLQSDARFAESFARQRAERLYGPRRIRAELVERGIDAADADRAIASLDVDFAESAATFYRRRYGRSDPEPDYAERVRRSQAMYRRGFDPDTIRDLV